MDRPSISYTQWSLSEHQVLCAEGKEQIYCTSGKEGSHYMVVIHQGCCVALPLEDFSARPTLTLGMHLYLSHSFVFCARSLRMRLWRIQPRCYRKWDMQMHAIATMGLMDDGTTAGMRM